MLLRTFRCPGCGAPVTGATDAILLVCENCGSFVALDLAAIHRDGRFAALARDQLAAMARPSELQARLATVTATMEEARQRGDRQAWRQAAPEFFALQAACHPDLFPDSARDAATRAGWHRTTVALGELQTFDPTVGSRLASFQGAAGAITEAPDRVAAARTALDAARAYYEALKGHPDCPAGALSEGVDHHARELLRTTIASFTFVLGPGVATRIYREVLGDREADASSLMTCGGCGAALPPADEGARRRVCPYCGTLVDRFDEDPWLVATLAIFRSVTDDLVRRGALDSSEPAMAAAAYLVLPFQDGEGVSRAAARAFLDRAVPWLDRNHVIEGLTLYRGSTEPGSPPWQLLTDLMEDLRDWVPDPATRPAPPEPRGAPPPVTAGPGDPWVEQTLAWLRMTGGEATATERAQHLLSYCVLPFQQGESITVEQAWFLVETLGPTIDRTALGEAVRSWLPVAEDDPPQRAFLQALAARLPGQES